MAPGWGGVEGGGGGGGGGLRVFRQSSHDPCKVAAWQSVNNNQTIAFHSHHGAQ